MSNDDRCLGAVPSAVPAELIRQSVDATLSDSDQRATSRPSRRPRTWEPELDLQVLTPGSPLPGTDGPVRRVWSILRYYSPARLLRRLQKQLSQRLLPPTIGRLPIPRDLKSNVAVIERFRQVGHVLADTDSARSGRFRWNRQASQLQLLGVPAPFSAPIDWRDLHAAAPTQLWRFQLHYQEYLLDGLNRSAVAGDDAEQVWAVVQSWIDQHQPDGTSRRHDAWHPYCISRRLPVWFAMWALQPPPEWLRSKVLGSAWQQARYLARNLERDVLGNHLLENLRALMLAAAFFEPRCSESWRGASQARLLRTLDQQVLEHGEHFERAPMYHCQALANLLQILTVSDLPASTFDRLASYVERMWQFLASIIHGDGEIPLLADSCFGEAPSVRQIEGLADCLRRRFPGRVLQSAGAIRPAAWAGAAPSFQSGRTGPYWTARYGHDCFLFDCGPVAADSLPAHGHCDMLGFEASIDGCRWLVDSGNYNYQQDAMREYCRSSRAHNVVTTEHRDLCQVWGKFRMGFRGRPRIVEVGQDEHLGWCVAEHDALRYVGVTSVRRIVTIHPDGVWSVVDTVTADRACRVTGYLHLHPDVELESWDNSVAVLRRGSTCRKLTFANASQVQLARAYYCPEFGQRTPQLAFVYQADVDRQGSLGWMLQHVDGSVQLRCGPQSGDPAEARWDCDSAILFRWPPPPE